MKKVLLFGTGDGAKKYLLKYSNSMKVLAAFDNDIKKHGSYLNDIKIHSPNEINCFTYDQIIIVSQWAKEIYEQLINELSIPSNKIVIPAKESIKEASKPFEDPHTRELARKIIRGITNQAIKDNIPVFVDFGTLLGIVRDNDIIEWDDDVDFSINSCADDFKFSKWIVSTVNQMKLPINIIISSKTIENQEVNYSIKFENIDTHNFRQFVTSISLRKNIKENSIHLPSGGMWYAPKKHFERYELFDWKGQKIYVPYDYENYLTFLYGDWKTPKKNITMADYAHLGKVDYENFKDLGIGYKEVL